MAKPAYESKIHASIGANEAGRVYTPSEVTRDDFFRLKRVGNCWQVEMTRLSPDRKSVVFIRDVYAEDVLPNVEAKLRSYVIEAEMRR